MFFSENFSRSPEGPVCPIMSYLDPTMGTGGTRQPDSNQTITRNGQFFSLTNQSNSGLKVFLSSVPSCNGTSAEAIRTWYMLFTKMAAMTGFYLHPYFCFRKHGNSDYGFTCRFDTAPIAHVPAVPEIIHQAENSAGLARNHVPANPDTRQLEILAIVSSALVPRVLACAGVPETLAQPPLQHDFHGAFQQRIPNWTSQIWTAMSKAGVFKRNSPEHQILHQNLGQ